MISSQNVSNLIFDEFAIKPSDAEFSITGLRVLAKVRVTRITTLDRQLIVRCLARSKRNNSTKELQENFSWHERSPVQ
ncbi:MAG: hypothetical protein LH679_15585 [Cyanobacteria bacterium CAN_BIN43]|nr:hypothetical protein [Cyanobacteria bacterium CAN_BIN43]